MKIRERLSNVLDQLTGRAHQRLMLDMLSGKALIALQTLLVQGPRRGSSPHLILRKRQAVARGFGAYFHSIDVALEEELALSSQQRNGSQQDGDLH